MSAERFFRENIKQPPPEPDVMEQNLNRGLLELAKQVDAIQKELARQSSALSTIEHLARQHR